MVGREFGSAAPRKPCMGSTNESPSLHCRYPLAPGTTETTCSQVLPPSEVCQTVVPAPLHWVSGTPPVASHPCWSSMKEMSGLGKLPGGMGRCSHVVPRLIQNVIVDEDPDDVARRRAQHGLRRPCDWGRW